jgi:hypothetical protein
MNATIRKVFIILVMVLSLASIEAGWADVRNNPYEIRGVVDAMTGDELMINVVGEPGPVTVYGISPSAYGVSYGDQNGDDGIIFLRRGNYVEIVAYEVDGKYMAASVKTDAGTILLRVLVVDPDGNGNLLPLYSWDHKTARTISTDWPAFAAD